MKAYEVRQFGIENLASVERDEPQAAAREVVVKFHAASLNYRDLMFVKGTYNPKAKLPAVPFSDGAGEVVATGGDETRWKIGDRVCPIFTQGWIEGAPTLQKNRTALGAGDRDGVLREYGAFDENALVKIPDSLSYEEAATLPCAAVTAWNALVRSGNLKAGETVLTLGTGGVSVFALQFAKMHGARVVATSSSDEKLERARELGADVTINYRSAPDWDKEVLSLTNKTGVDHVIEVGGAGTLGKSLNSVRVGGHVALIGVLAGGGDFDPRGILMKSVRVQGIYVGSRQMFEELNRAIEADGLKPVIGKTFAFAEAREALRYMESGAHFGKIVIKY
ncbi:MAG TPA: NAD(P)-dependent alcohol dehydrogenase [Pyrinomonadaceae bacterium]|jgi:NADPH:quinone reductase-like Zn-dependent oxidoreductase|nr:NAD(P)-dependent alcohol dehydrogenase [Pyrinomonadaceae bacterium]